MKNHTKKTIIEISNNWHLYVDFVKCSKQHENFCNRKAFAEAEELHKDRDSLADDLKSQRPLQTSINATLDRTKMP